MDVVWCDLKGQHLPAGWCVVLTLPYWTPSDFSPPDISYGLDRIELNRFLTVISNVLQMSRVNDHSTYKQ